MLTARAVETAKQKKKPYKLYDTAGLYLHVQPSGSKLWRFRYRINGKEQLLALGSFPLFGLADARRRRDDARRILADGGDPSQERRAAREEERRAGETFRTVSEEWTKVRLSNCSENHQRITRRRLELYLLPTLGDHPIADITSPMVLAPLRAIEARSKHETAHRALQIASQVMRYGVATGRCTNDPTSALRGALQPAVVRHMPAPSGDPKRVGEILRMLDGYEGSPVVAAAIQLLPFVFCRPGELRTMKWKDVDLDDEMPAWRFIASKNGGPHVVPLSTQAVLILKSLRPHTGQHEWAFPCARSALRPMSDMACNAALRRVGIGKDELTSHGWRAVARTMLAERLGTDPKHVEAQLAHRVPDALGSAYNRTTYIKQRRAMMQEWADFLDNLKTKKTEEGA